MIIKKLFSLVLVTAMIILSLAGCRKVNGDEMSSGNVSDVTSTPYGIVDLIESESSELVSTDAVSSDTPNVPETPITDNTNNNNNNNNNNDANVGTVVQQPTTTNPVGQDIIGNGTKETPYLETPIVDPNSEHIRTVKTVSIPAGSSVYYGIYRAVGSMFTINSANSKVEYEGTTYTANNGKVSFKVTEPNNYKPDVEIIFKIYNTGSSAANFTITFENIEGSYMRPYSVNNIAKNTTHIDAVKEETKLYYEYIAEKSGTLHFYFTETITATKNFGFHVQNNKAKKDDSIPVLKNKNDDLTTADDDIYEVELEVEKGDHIEIHFITEKQGRGYPETNIEWYAEYK